MQKIILAVCLLMLALSAVNTGLLFMMVKGPHEKMEAVLKELEKLRPPVKDAPEKPPLPGKQPDGKGPMLPELPVPPMPPK